MAGRIESFRNGQELIQIKHDERSPRNNHGKVQFGVSTKMSTISDYLSHDHTRCDEAFVQAEEAVSKGDWARAAEEYQTFWGAMERHFGMEEGVLFPSFEACTGNTMGPTRVMRAEHIQMRELFQGMAEALEQRDSASFLGQAETLLIMMQQHNMKEEQILYPMTDQVLGGEREQLLERMRQVETPETQAG
jgi:DUF438 domain-containing protein